MDINQRTLRMEQFDEEAKEYGRDWVASQRLASNYVSTYYLFERSRKEGFRLMEDSDLLKIVELCEELAEQVDRIHFLLKKYGL